MAITPTTPLAVKNILLKDYDTCNEPDLVPFVDTASSIVSRVVDCAARKGIIISSTEQEIIGRWVAAYLYSSSDAPYTQRQTLRASGSFAKTWDSYLKAAFLADPSGCLQNAMNNNRVRAFWMGKRPSNQIPYDQRD